MDVPARAESSPGVTSLEDEHRQLVRQTVTYINQVAGEMMLRAYQIGAYVWETILSKGRAPYGQRLVQQIASRRNLQMSRSTLFNCISLARAYRELGAEEIVDRQVLVAQAFLPNRFEVIRLSRRADDCEYPDCDRSRPKRRVRESSKMTST